MTRPLGHGFYGTGTSKYHVQLKFHTVIKLSLVTVETTSTWKFPGTLSLSVGDNYTYTDDQDASKCFPFFKPMQYMCVQYTYYTYMCTNIFLCVWCGLAYAQGTTDMTQKWQCLYVYQVNTTDLKKVGQKSLYPQLCLYYSSMVFEPFIKSRFYFHNLKNIYFK